VEASGGAGSQKRVCTVCSGLLSGCAASNAMKKIVEITRDRFEFRSSSKNRSESVGSLSVILESTIASLDMVHAGNFGNRSIHFGSCMDVRAKRSRLDEHC